jgi:hypothetical protein
MELPIIAQLISTWARLRHDGNALFARQDAGAELNLSSQL